MPDDDTPPNAVIDDRPRPNDDDRTPVARRRFLATAGAAVVVGLAGCADDAADAGNGNGTPEGNGESTPTASQGDAATPGEDDGDAAAPRLAESLQYQESYAMAGTWQHDGETVQFTGRVDGQNVYWRVETSEGTSEFYRVDGDTYLVADGQCYRNSGNQPGPQGVNADGIETTARDPPDVTARGRTTIDGEPMFVYELSGEDVEMAGGATYYVHAESGFIRRIEASNFTMDFTDWGTAEPVSAPSMNCQSY